jgi:hypothetical protein
LRVKSGALLGFCVFSLWMGKPSSPESPKRIHNKSPRFPDVAPCPPENPSKVLPWPRGNFMMRDPVPQKSLTHVALVQGKFWDFCPRKIPEKCCPSPGECLWCEFLSFKNTLKMLPLSRRNFLTRIPFPN